MHLFTADFFDLHFKFFGIFGPHRNKEFHKMKLKNPPWTPRNTRSPSKQPAANGGDTKGQPQLPLNFALGFLSFTEFTHGVFSWTFFLNQRWPNSKQKGDVVQHHNNTHNLHAIGERLRAFLVYPLDDHKVRGKHIPKMMTTLTISHRWMLQVLVQDFEMKSNRIWLEMKYDTSWNYMHLTTYVSINFCPYPCIFKK